MNSGVDRLWFGEAVLPLIAESLSKPATNPWGANIERAVLDTHLQELDAEIPALLSNGCSAADAQPVPSSSRKVILDFSASLLQALM
jgi:hypothetical protein